MCIIGYHFNFFEKMGSKKNVLTYLIIEKVYLPLRYQPKKI